jgi:DnaJ homolog subfamily C member 25
MSRRSFSLLPVALLAVALLSSASALFCGSQNCYELLGVGRAATKSEIRRAYRRLSVENHPDKRPGDEAAAAEFRAIGDAYTALKDDGKRAKYDDFLDNPGKYWDFLMQNSKQVTPPKTNVLIAFTLIVGAFTVVNWVNMKFTYDATVQRMRESPEFKREVSRLVKTKAAKDVEEAESMINLEVVGLDAPHWENLIVVRVAKSPQRVMEYLKWCASWVVNYKILKKEFSKEDKEYLIQKNIKMSSLEFERLEESSQNALFEQEVWIPENAKEYLRVERIALNKAGKLRKKRKQAATAAMAADEADDLIE